MVEFCGRSALVTLSQERKVLSFYGVGNVCITEYLQYNFASLLYYHIILDCHIESCLSGVYKPFPVQGWRVESEAQKSMTQIANVLLNKVAA